jgi:hypothetical protein
VERSREFPSDPERGVKIRIIFYRANIEDGKTY